jgi:outer membrane protein
MNRSFVAKLFSKTSALNSFNNYSSRTNISKLLYGFKSASLLSVLLVAQNSNAISLNDALAKAYETNPMIKSAKEEYIATIQQYPQAISETFLPDISIQTQNTDTKSNQKNQSGARASTNSERFSRTFSVKQNLFAGGSGVSRLAAVKHSLDGAKARFVYKEQEFFTKAIDTYIDVLVANERVESSKSFVNSSTKEYESTLEKLKVGESTKTEVALSKAQMLRARAMHTGEEAGLKSKFNAFKAFFDTEFENTEFPSLPDNLPATYEEFKDLALNSSLELKSAMSNLKSQKNMTNASKGALLPRVDLFANQSRSSTIEDIYNSNSKSSGSSYTTGVTVNIPILSSGGSEHSKIRAEKAKHRKAAHDLANVKLNIETQLISIWENFIAQKQVLEFSTEQVEASRMAYEGTKSAYDVGLATIVDVLKHEKELYDVIAENIKNKQNLLKASYQIKSQLAQLTAKHLGIEDNLFDADKELRKTRFKIIGF